jgi:exopolyphosphatase/guanosine-5'-triphosphate,3'-diphosphate pyrophosphatase
VNVAVVDIGTNSTRLLLADVDDDDGTVTALDRRSIVTRLGEGVEQTGALGDEPQARVLRALDSYRDAIDRADVRTGVLTSAVRDASNGDAFVTRIRDDYGIDAQTITGDEEAQLTFAGATLQRDVTEPVLVADIGGGSTELVIGTNAGVDFHVSTQVGVVRHGERHGDDLDALRTDVRAVLEDALPANAPARVIAVAGTATQAASMDLELTEYDHDAVEGHVLSIDKLHARLTHLAALPLDERKQVTGLHPDRAPTIVAGLIILTEILEAVGATEVEVSDRDLLYGRALAAASA